MNNQRLFDFVDGTLDAYKRKEVLEACDTDPSVADCVMRLERARDALPDACVVTPSPKFVGDVVRASQIKRKPDWIWRALGATTAVCAVALTAFWVHAPTPPDGTFQPRGVTQAGLSKYVGLEITRHPEQGTATTFAFSGQEPSALSTRDGLSFAVRNRSGEALYYAIVGVDAQRNVHWIYPETPGPSLKVDAQQSIALLPHGVRPDGLPTGTLRIVAMFSSRAFDANQTFRSGIEGIKHPDLELTQSFHFQIQEEHIP